MSELLRLRAVTVVDRGDDGDVDDFRWLAPSNQIDKMSKDFLA